MYRRLLRHRTCGAARACRGNQLWAVLHGHDQRARPTGTAKEEGVCSLVATTPERPPAVRVVRNTVDPGRVIADLGGAERAVLPGLRREEQLWAVVWNTLLHPPGMAAPRSETVRFTIPRCLGPSEARNTPVTANVDADEHIIPPGQLDQWQKCRTIQSVPIVTPRRRSTALRPVRPTPLMEANILDGAGACLDPVLKWTHSQEAASPRGLLSRKAQWRFIDGSGP
ncbi:hypothetical protein Purlil1_14059 [Purpureocillium lilacinum]|uniref:Uncharacterized protein n=1 Tax=Purpureocillium lilacinum TaxID=33203 RepID=A0ABR0BCC3_PURLI|nr:hypothetical protein Purlil1_14059 [Purpureocillium lilacinum]